MEDLGGVGEGGGGVTGGYSSTVDTIGHIFVEKKEEEEEEGGGCPIWVLS